MVRTRRRTRRSAPGPTGLPAPRLLTNRRSGAVGGAVHRSDPTFLKDAKVIRTRTTAKGVTAPKRLTLSDGNITHDAVFQAIDERKMVANLGGGGRQATDGAQLRRFVQVQHRGL